MLEEMEVKVAMRMRSIRSLLVLTFTLLLVFSTRASTTAQAPIKLKMGYSVWVGYGPLFIAQDKGYFKDQGLDVELVKVEDPKDRFTALAGNQLDGLVSTLYTMAQYWKAETPF